MKIGVDATCWGNNRGFGRFTRELLGALLARDRTNEYIFFIDQFTEGTGSIPENARVETAKTTASAMKAASADGSRSLGDVWAMTQKVRQEKIDVFFFPAVYSYFPILNRTKVVVTLHDVIADHHPKLIFPDARAKAFWKMKQWAAIRQAHKIATVSDYSKSQIAEYFRLPPSRISVISEAAQSIFIPSGSLNGNASAILGRMRVKPGSDFLLYVGGISPHKNLAKLIEAFSEIVADGKNDDLRLVLVGDYKDDPFFSAYPSLAAQVRTLRLDDRIIFAGYVPDDELVTLYNLAALVVLPSFEEGFGLPAIEAMACGTPVAASDRGALPEILGDAGRFFDPHDAKSIQKTVEDILADTVTRSEMKKAGLSRAAEFTWSKAAADALKIFEEVAAGR